MTEQDPGSKGQKLSKSDSEEKRAERNKSYEKVLDAQIAYIRAKQAGLDEAGDLLIRWTKKSEWHEKAFGW